MEQYVIYLRKSRADTEAGNDIDVLARHERALVEVGKKLKLNITEIYREIVSGDTIAARPVMQKLLSEVGQGLWAGVLVMDIDRLARGDTIDQGMVAQSFKYSDTKIITPAKTYDPNNESDEEFFEFSLFMSRREYKTINRRMQRGRIAAVKEGRFIGQTPPYGYVKIKAPDGKGYTLAPDPDRAQIVKMIFDLYVNGEPEPNGGKRPLGMSLIAKKLNKMRIPPPKGDVWVLVTIRDMLMNPVYMGNIRWNWRPTSKKIVNGLVTAERKRTKPEDWLLVQGLHEPLISQELFDAANPKKEKRHVAPVNMRKNIQNPLAGLIICGVCGRRMVRRPYNNGYPDGLMCPLPGCSNVSSLLSLVERRLIERLADWLAEYRLQYDGIPEIVTDFREVKQKALEDINRELHQLNAQKENLYDLLERGIYDTNTFLDRSKIIGERTAQLQSDQQSLSAELQIEESQNESHKRIIPNVEYILNVYNSLTNPKDKNDLLKQVIEKAVYTKNIRSRWGGSPDEFELVIYPKFPMG